MQTQNNNNAVVAPVLSAVTKPKLTTTQAASIFAIDPSNRPEIDINEGMHIIVDKCIAALVDTGLVFDRGSILVCIDRDNSIHTLTKATVKFALSKIFKFVKSSWNPQANQLVKQPATIPDYVGDTIISLTKWDNMPIVDALTDHPILTADNRLLAPGYDIKTRVFGRFDEDKFDVPANPTLQDAVDALKYIQRLLQTFDFEAAEDEAAALAMFFTAVSRAGIPTALMTLISASMPGSGKGYLATLACWLAKSEEPIARQLQDDKAEMHKALMSVLMATEPVCFFDEIEMSDIDMPCLRTFTTAPVYGGRCLGYIRNIHFPNRTFVSGTGNNVAPTADMARRILWLHLNPQCENPSLRRFGYICDDPLIKSANADVKANRNIFISKILTIQRAFLLAQQRGETVQPSETLGGFDEWESLCRLPIQWLTGVDPAAKSIQAMKENAQKDELATMMSVWVDHFGKTPVTPAQAVKNEGFEEACNENMRRKPGSTVTNITLGMWLKRHKGQIVGKKMFDIAGKDSHTKAIFWTVRELD